MEDQTDFLEHYARCDAAAISAVVAFHLVLHSIMRNNIIIYTVFVLEREICDPVIRSGIFDDLLGQCVISLFLAHSLLATQKPATVGLLCRGR